MPGTSNRDRAYIMALGAWTRFGHSREQAQAFAARIADIGATSGVSAAAQAISDDCNAQGLDMSSARVLKGLASDLQTVRGRLAQIGAVEELTSADFEHKVPPGVAALLDGDRRAASGDDAGGAGRWVIAVIVIVAATVALHAALGWGWLISALAGAVLGVLAMLVVASATGRR